ncbi:MAG: hypothetical protein GY757_41225, partial [bacterium]|nr:hypothetical protein [bacterium]
HLVVDGVSWRVLLEDLKLGLTQNKFQEKTDSFKYWVQKQVEYAQSNQLLKELPYWKSIEETNVEVIPTVNNIKPEERKAANLEMIKMEMTAENTSALLTTVNRAFNTAINDTLLTALGLAISEWSPSVSNKKARLDNVLVELEGHGRENIIEDMDINRTVGWFTTQYPVILDMEKTEDLTFTIKNVKETVRRIPNKGIGHGILKHLTLPEKLDCKTAKEKKKQFKQFPEILLNYLGDMAGDLIDPLLGDSLHPDFAGTHKIDIEGMRLDGQLILYFIYNKLEYDKNTMQKLVDIYKAKLTEIITLCKPLGAQAIKEEKEMYATTPSDLGYNKLPIASLEKLKTGFKERFGQHVEIESIYPLTAMQEGLFLATVKNKQAYFVHFLFSVPSGLDTEKLKRSFNLLVEKHEIFRTLYFISEETGAAEPLQMVLKNREPEVVFVDNSDKKSDISEIMKEDKSKGFDLSIDFPTRATLVQTGEETDPLIWTLHNLCVDGTSIGIFVKDLITFYETLMEEKEVLIVREDYPFRSYVDWIEDMDFEEGLEYWRETLAGYTHKPVLSASATGKKAGAYDYDLKQHFFTFTEGISDALTRTAARNRVTLNTLFQTMWGTLLQKISGSEDVLFGAVMSGRSAAIPGIDEMVGVFTNEIPVRIKAGEAVTFLKLLKEMQVHS